MKAQAMPTNSPAVTSVLPAAELNDRNIKAAVAGDILKDKEIRGLHLRCFDGSKGFYLYYRTKAGVQRKPKIGDVGAITLAQARKIAKDWLGQVAAGGDPSLSVAEARAEPTLQELWDMVHQRHYKGTKSEDEAVQQWNRYVKAKLGAKKISAITFEMMDDLHKGMADTPYAANRLMALLSKVFNYGIKPLKVAKENPTKGVQRFPERKRKRYMKGEEAARIAEVLHREAKANPQSVAFIYLLILTGARSGEIAAAKWSQINGTRLTLTEHKTDGTGEDRIINLPQAALDVLDRLPKTTGTITGIKSPKNFWDRVRKEALCPDLRLHDLRHSFASAAVSAGLSLTQIGELLGHKSAQTTMRYAHLMEEAASAAVTATADVIALRMKKVPA
jgi:integrase